MIKRNLELNVQNVRKLFNECVLTENNMIMNIDHKTHSRRGYKISCNTIDYAIEENEDTIGHLIDQLPDSGSKIKSFPFCNAESSIFNLCFNKNGEEWTTDIKDVDMLVLMGIACGKLRYTCPSELWKTLPGKAPFVIKTKFDGDKFKIKS